VPSLAAIHPVEQSAADIFANLKRQLLAFFAWRAGIENHRNRQPRCRKPLCRKHAVAIDGEVRASVMRFGNQAGTRRDDGDVRIGRRRRKVAVGRPISQQAKPTIGVFDRNQRGDSGGRNRDGSGQRRKHNSRCEYHSAVTHRLQFQPRA
jgi:hypothetical protein